MSLRTGVMEAKKFNIKLLNTWDSYYLQPKINGVRCRSILTPGLTPRIYSSQGNEFKNIPHIVTELKVISDELDYPITLDGEIYRHGMKLQHIISRARRTVNAHPFVGELDYIIFDLIDLNLTQDLRIRRLESLRYATRTLKSVRIINTHTITERHQFDNYVLDYLSKGYEGVILRERSAYYEYGKRPQLMKYKASYHSRAMVLGTTEEVSIDGFNKNSLGALICQENPNSPEFRVGTGFTARQRQAFWQDQLGGKWIKFKFFERSANGTPIHPVFVELI